MIRRREFITLLGGAGAAWRLGAEDVAGSADVDNEFLAALRQGLSEISHVAGPLR